MASTTSFRLRRLGDRQTEVQKQLIAFQLHGQQFLIAIEAVYKAVVFEQPLDPAQLDHNELAFEDRVLPIIDGKHLILGEAPTPLKRRQPIHIALVVRDQGEKAVLLPIDSAPSLCRVKESSLVKLPKTYNIRCVALMTEAAANPPLCFLLDPEMLNTLALERVGIQD